MTTPSAQILSLPWRCAPAAASTTLEALRWSPLQAHLDHPHHASRITSYSTTGVWLDWRATAHLTFGSTAPADGLEAVILVIHDPHGSPTWDPAAAEEAVREIHLRLARKYDQYSWDEYAGLIDAGFLPSHYRCYHWYDAQATGGTDILLAIVGGGASGVQIVLSYRHADLAQAESTFADTEAVTAAVLAAAMRITPPSAGVVTRPASDGTWMATLVSDYLVDQPYLVADAAYRCASRRIHLGMRPFAAGEPRGPRPASTTCSAPTA
jgi:hypothetical protein